MIFDIFIILLMKFSFPKRKWSQTIFGSVLFSERFTMIQEIASWADLRILEMIAFRSFHTKCLCALRFRSTNYVSGTIRHTSRPFWSLISEIPLVSERKSMKVFCIFFVKHNYFVIPNTKKGLPLIPDGQTIF